MNRARLGAQLSELDTQLVEPAGRSSLPGPGPNDDEPTLIYGGVPRVGVRSVGETHYGEAVVLDDCKPSGRAKKKGMPTASGAAEAVETAETSETPKVDLQQGKNSTPLRTVAARMRARMGRAEVPWRTVLAGAAIGLGGAMGSAWGMLEDGHDATDRGPAVPADGSRRSHALTGVPPGNPAAAPPPGASAVPPGNPAAAPPQGLVASQSHRHLSEVPHSVPMATPLRHSHEPPPDPGPVSAPPASKGRLQEQEASPEVAIARRSRQAIVHQIEGRCQAAEALYEGLRADAVARQDFERSRLFTALMRGASHACSVVGGRSGAHK